MRTHDDPANFRNRVLLFAKQRLEDDAVFVDRDAPAETVEEEEQGGHKTWKQREQHGSKPAIPQPGQYGSEKEDGEGKYGKEDGFRLLLQGE